MSVKKIWNCNSLSPFVQVQSEGAQFVEHEGSRKFIRHFKTTNSFNTNGIFMNTAFRPKAGDFLFGYWRVHEGALGSGVESFLMVTKNTPGIDYSSAVNLYMMGGHGWASYGGESSTIQEVDYNPLGIWWKWAFHFQPDGKVKTYVRKVTDLNWQAVSESVSSDYLDKACRLATNVYSGVPDVGTTYDIENIVWTDEEGE